MNPRMLGSLVLAACLLPAAAEASEPWGIRLSDATPDAATTAGIAWNTDAAGESQVEYGTSTAYGQTVVVDHGSGMHSWYCHCSSISVSEGQQVSRGQVIARVGSTGMSTGPHLHFEVRVNGSPVDPLGYL